MTIDEQIRAMIAGLRPWCQQFGGTIHVAHDVPHLFKILGENPGKVRLGILFVGDDSRDEHMSDVTGRVDCKYWLAFSRGYSLEAYAGKSLVEGVAGGPPMYVVIRSAVAMIRCLRLGTEDEPMPYYGGTGLLTFQGVTTDAYRTEIKVASDLGDLTGDDEEDENE